MFLRGLTVKIKQRNVFYQQSFLNVLYVLFFVVVETGPDMLAHGCERSREEGHFGNAGGEEGLLEQCSRADGKGWDPVHK